MSKTVVIPGSANAWQAFRYAKTGLIGMVAGKPVDLVKTGGSDEVLEEAAILLTQGLSSEFGFADQSGEVAQILHGRNTTTVYIRFSKDDTKVFGAYSAVTFNSKGELVSIKARGFGSVTAGYFKASASDLASDVLQTPEYQGTTLVSSEQIWFPLSLNDQLVLRAACEIILTHADPLIRPVIIVDASTGDVLSVENRIVFENLPGDTRGLYRPFRPSDRPLVGIFPEEIVTLNGGQQIFSGIDGNFVYNVNPNAGPFRIRSELRGRWVDVNFEDGADAVFNAQIDRIEHVTVDWTRDNSRDDERMLYYHTNLIHAYWKTLDPNFRGMDRVIPATCEYGDHYDNAFWNGQGMFFGNGPTLGNLALKGDVIQHEFGHGVTGSIYPWNVLPYTGESGALNEAWSDYFPCSISNESFMGEATPGGAGALRNIDNNLVYPRDWYGEVHYDSRIISAAMWHSREVLGRNVTDSLFHFARYELGNTFLTYFTDVLVTDDDDGDITNGTPHYLTLYEQFGRHGIGPGIYPTIRFTHIEPDDADLGNGNKIWQPGETIDVRLAVCRDGTLFPPPAENVIARLTCDHPSVNILIGEVRLGTIAVGDTVNAETNLRFSIAQDALLSFANLIFTMDADQFGTIKTDTVRIPIGQPHLLLVRDADNGSDRTEWYRNSLDSLEVIYSEYSVSSPHVSLDQWLSLFQNVIWFTGDARDGFLSNTNRTKISDFIDGGGNFVLTGQSIGLELRETGFLEEYFGARVIADSVNQFLIDGVGGDPVGKDMTLLILGSQGANNQHRPGAIEAVGDGIECFRWTRLENRPGAGVRMAHQNSGAKTLFLSFGIEGIGGHGRTNSRGDLFISIMDWFGVEHGIANQDPIPVLFGVGEAYPNPFNSSVSLQFTLNIAGNIEFTVFDISGRLIRQGYQYDEVGRNLLSLNADNWGSGYYFVKIKFEGVTSTRRLLLIR